MTKPKIPVNDDLGRRLAEVAALLERSVSVLNATLAEIRCSQESTEEEDEDDGRSKSGTRWPQGSPERRQ